MNDQIHSLFEFLNSAVVKSKYELYRNGGGVVNSSYQTKPGSGFRVTNKEREIVCAEYNAMTPITNIAIKLERTPDSIRNVLKKAGIYEKDRETLAGRMKGYTKTKTVRVD